MSDPTPSPWRPHPWHGLAVGPDPPRLVTAFVEITPFDPIKWELDKASGYLKVDRPQRTSSLPPLPYGFIPRTYCGPRVGALAPGAEGGDGDPLDVCVVSERPISRSEILLTARVIGGLRMIDRGEADDKIVGVLSGDAFWGGVTELAELPPAMIDRLRHYFMTYKLLPGTTQPVEIAGIYGAAEAQEVVVAAQADYDARFGATGAG